MTTMTSPSPQDTRATPPDRGPVRGRAIMALLAALVAGGTLVVMAPMSSPAPRVGRVSLATTWPQAQRAEIPANLSDGPAYQPMLFLDARTSIGVSATPDATSMRLVQRAADGSIRQLRRLPIDDNPTFGPLTVTGDDLVWAETTDRSRYQLWTANLRTGRPARRLTADTGKPLFFASQYDLVIADGNVHWVAGASDPDLTEVRSIPLTGGAVTTRTERGTWILGAWPWLVDDGTDTAGATRLRNMSTNQDVTVATSGPQTTTCSPIWCRTVATSADSTMIDLMHPDGTARRRIADGTASPALIDVAVLDRFEPLSQPGPNSDLTGTAQLLIYDTATKQTLDINANVSNASYGNGVLWYSTGTADSIIWHTIDLRTI